VNWLHAHYQRPPTKPDGFLEKEEATERDKKSPVLNISGFCVLFLKDAENCSIMLKKKSNT
jgi:hypothetical protein